VTPAELEERRAWIGASEVHHLFGLGSLWELFAEKRPDVCGRPETDDEEDEDFEEPAHLTDEDLAMLRGNELELPVARLAAAKIAGDASAAAPLKVLRPIVVPTAHLGATPDFVYQWHPLNVLLEIKTAIGGDWGEPGTDAVPFKVLLQVNTQLGCLRYTKSPIVVPGLGGELRRESIDLERAYVARLDGRLQLSIYVIPYSSVLFVQTIERAAALWKHHVEPGVPPEPGDSEKARAWLREKYPAAVAGAYLDGGADEETKVGRWLEVKRLAAPLKKEEKELGNWLRDHIGDRAGLVVRGLSGCVALANDKASAKWKSAARLIAEAAAARIEGGWNVEEVLEQAAEDSKPANGKRVLRWSSKLNKLK